MEIFSKTMSFWWEHYFCTKKFWYKNMFMLNSSTIQLHVNIISCKFHLPVKLSEDLDLWVLEPEGGKKNLKWPLLTFLLVGGSPNIDKVLARYVIYMCTKNQIDRTNGVGGVRAKTYKHAKSNKNMDCMIMKYQIIV